MGLVCFTILHYKSAVATSKCIASILKLKGQNDIHIIVYDNGSNDESLDHIRERFQDFNNVEYHKSTSNDGFTKGNNKAYLLAKRKSPKFIVCLNNDIEIRQKNFITLLNNVYTKYHPYIIGPDVYCPKEKQHQSPLHQKDGIEQYVYSCLEKEQWQFNHVDQVINEYIRFDKTKSVRNMVPYKLWELRLKIIHRNYNKYYNKTIFNPVLQGSCIIATPEYINKERVLFEPDTEFYGEELLLALKCKTLGYLTLYSNKLKVVHWHGIASGFNNIPTVESIRQKNIRTIHSYKIYLQTVKNNPWEKAISNEHKD